MCGMASPPILVNGEPRDLARHATLAALVDDLQLTGARIAVEHNGTIVPRSRLAEVTLRPGDRVEIVRAIGGG